MNNEMLALEQEILGAFLNHENLLREYKEKIRPKHFQIKIHQNFYNFLLDMEKNNIDIDLVSFMSFNKHRVGKVDGISYITQVSNCVPSLSGFASKVELFVDNYKLSILKATRFEIDTLGTTEEITKLLENTLGEVYNTTTGSEIDLGVEYDDYINWLYSEATDEGFKSGLHNLDAVLGRFQPGRMIGIFARSGVGKSTVAIQIALNMAMQKRKVIYGSGEMSRAEVLNKMASSKLNIPYQLLAERNITLDDKDKVAKMVAYLMNVGLYITNETNLNKFLATVKAYKLKFGLDVVFVDYVNKYVSGGKGNLTERIGEVTSALKDFALKEKVCVVLLAQANRESDKKVGEINEKISESDIQDSARIEQDCDQVIALYRNKKLDNNEYRVINKKNLDYDSKSAEKNPDCINFTIVKNRHGEKKTLAFKWEGKYSRVSNFMR